MSKKRILQAAEPAKSATAPAFLPAFPYCNSLPVLPLQIFIRLYIFNSLLSMLPVSPPSIVVLDCLPRPLCWGQLVWHTCRVAKKLEHENWLDLRDQRAKKRADPTAKPSSSTKLPADGSFQLVQLHFFQLSASLSLLWLELATDLREWGGWYKMV